MFAKARVFLTLAVFILVGVFAVAQTPPPDPPPLPKQEPLPPPPAANAVAATVNGHAISELAVYRGLLNVPAAHRDKARKEALTFLIDNMVIDHYLIQVKVQVDAKEVDERIEQIRKEAANDKTTLEEELKRLFITEAEMRQHLLAAMRWDKFVLGQGTDKVLKEMFEANPTMFDGTLVKARHILVSTENVKPEEAKMKLTSLRKTIEDEANGEVAKLPAGTDNLAKEKERTKALEKAFATVAQKESACPSKTQGGDIGWFPRAGKMVEPFARAAFALKPHQMSEPVATEFGYHLILAVDHQPGKQVKFEEVKGFVVEIYAERLREAVLTAYKTRSKIEIKGK